VFPEPQQSLACAQQVVKYRKNIAFRQTSELTQFVQQNCGAEPQKLFSPEVTQILRMRSDTFSTEATGVAGDTERTIRAVVSRQNPQQPKILYWKVI
jgi:hypothetical protein